MGKDPQPLVIKPKYFETPRPPVPTLPKMEEEGGKTDTPFPPPATNPPSLHLKRIPFLFVALHNPPIIPANSALLVQGISSTEGRSSYRPLSFSLLFWLQSFARCLELSTGSVFFLPPVRCPGTPCSTFLSHPRSTFLFPQRPPSASSCLPVSSKTPRRASANTNTQARARSFSSLPVVFFFFPPPLKVC